MARNVKRQRWARTSMAVVLLLGGCTVVDTVDPASETEPKPEPTKAGEVVVPVRVISRGGGTLVMIPVKVDGSGPYEFILDTGASTSAIDRRLVRRLALPKTGETANINGVTGAAALPVVRLDGWEVGGQKLKRTTMPMINLGTSAYGLLGSDELRRFGAVRVDYRGSKLVLKDR